MKGLRKMKRNQRGFSGLELVLVIVVVAVIGGLGWYAYSRNKKQSETDTTTAKQTTKTETAEPVVADDRLEFKSEKFPYSFKYAKDWQIGDETYSSEVKVLKAPNTKEEEQPIGGTVVVNGAVITVTVGKAEQSVAEQMEDLSYMYSDTNKITVGDLEATQTTQSYESQPTRITMLVKDGYLYSINFNAKELKASSHYADYQKLLESFKFN